MLVPNVNVRYATVRVRELTSGFRPLWAALGPSRIQALELTEKYQAFLGG